MKVKIYITYFSEGAGGVIQQLKWRPVLGDQWEELLDYTLDRSHIYMHFKMFMTYTHLIFICIFLPLCNSPFSMLEGEMDASPSYMRSDKYLD